WAVAARLRGFRGAQQAEGVDARGRGVAAQRGALRTSLADAVPLALDVLGVAAESSSRTTMDLAGFMRRLLRSRSAAQPTLVLIDDAHWLDPASHDLVRELAAAVRGTRSLLLTNFRPEYRPAWTGGS